MQTTVGAPPTLEATKIEATVRRLYKRITERFPQSGLASTCHDLVQISQQTADRAQQLARPYLGVRFGVLVLVLAGLGAQFAAARYLRVNAVELEAGNLIQGLEAAVNLLILFGAAVWFLMSLERRLKRARVLAALHELRSLAHVIDMHQLTKDPTVVLGPRTASSPVREMNEFQLTRYLDYCAEMLALIGKLAALYAEKTRDTAIVSAVNDIESLAGNLGRKIWQKITIIGQLVEQPRK
jgi:hypothetical protein